MDNCTAWGDESIRILAEEPLYLIAACILDNVPDEQIKALENLKPKGAKKVHWRDMGQASQKKALGILSEVPQSTYIISESIKTIQIAM